MRILFQGDSITDTGRNREDFYDLGGGYPKYVAELLSQSGAELEYINRGISGDRTRDVYDRRQSDIFDLKPDIVTLLISINDVWRIIDKRGEGITAEQSEANIDMLLCDIKEKLPDAKLVLIEPFLLHGTATDEHYEGFRSEAERRAEIISRQAKKHGCRFVPLMHRLDEAAREKAPAELLLDGVHPTEAGHRLIAEELCATLLELLQ